MSFFNNQKNLQRWFAAVTSDYETVTSQFLAAEGDWSYMTFRKKAQKCATLYLHHCAVGKGKNMNEQYDFVTKILIAMAKEMWLVAPMGNLIRAAATDEEPPEHEALSRVKQMVAGFYLTYTMYKSRIVLGSNDHIKINMDSQDLDCFYYFKKCILETDNKVSIFVKKLIHYMLADLILDQAFEFVAEATMRGINPLTRLYNNTMKSGASNMNKDLKDQQYNHVLPTGFSELSKNLVKFEAKKTSEFRKYLSSISAVRPSACSSSSMELVPYVPTQTQSSQLMPYLPIQSSQLATLDQLVQPTQLTKVMEASAVCHLLNDRPVQTISNVLANSIADRAMMFESRKRIERRALQQRKSGASMTLEPHSLSTAKRPGSYIKEGGVFGRKRSKDGQLAITSTAAKQPNESTSNLWNYINSGIFCSSATVADNSGRDGLDNQNQEGLQQADYDD